jgi:hypothetical protein
MAMGARARARVLAKFSLDAEAGRIAKVYQLLMQPPAKGPSSPG